MIVILNRYLNQWRAINKIWTKLALTNFSAHYGSLVSKKMILAASRLTSNIVMWRHIAHTSVTRHQLSMRMRIKMKFGKTYARQVISIELRKTRKHHLQACHRKETTMFTSHPGASLTFSMFINLINRSLTILFHLFYSHFNWYNKIDIVICKIDQSGDIDWKLVDEFAYCKYIVWFTSHDLR